MPKAKKRWITLIVLFIILWTLFAVTRQGEFTTYVPFSGRVFSVEPERVDAIFIQNGTTGEQHFFETPEEKAWIAERLNSLRYSLWLPTIPLARGGWSYRVAVEADGTQYSYYFSDHHMTVNGIRYVFPGEQLDALREFVEQK